MKKCALGFRMIWEPFVFIAGGKFVFILFVFLKHYCPFWIIWTQRCIRIDCPQTIQL